MVDHLSSSIEAKAFRSQAAGPLLEWFRSRVEWHAQQAGKDGGPVPGMLHTDNGGPFVAAALSEYCEAQNIGIVHGMCRRVETPQRPHPILETPHSLIWGGYTPFIWPY